MSFENRVVGYLGIFAFERFSNASDVVTEGIDWLEMNTPQFEIGMFWIAITSW
jgi:hypothetical protein